MQRLVLETVTSVRAHVEQLTAIATSDADYRTKVDRIMDLVKAEPDRESLITAMTIVLASGESLPAPPLSNR